MLYIIPSKAIAFVISAMSSLSISMAFGFCYIATLKEFH